MSLSVALRHEFSDRTIDVAFEAPTPGVVALFGPSGAGKSTVIKAVAGLLRPGASRIVQDDEVLADSRAGIWVRPERRRIGLVFQDARLFPHMSVANNLRFGMRRVSGARIGLDDVVSLLDLGRLMARRPHSLSGGETQRVAIGRALLAQPRLLLMDEPLASLDAARKAEILPFLARLDRALRVPILYVTHALDEVGRLADTLVLIEEGRVIAAGPLPEIAARADLPLARRSDAAAVLPAVVEGHDPARGLTRLLAGGTHLWVPLIGSGQGVGVRVRIPAREVILARRAPDAISVHNIVPGTTRAIAADAQHRAALVEVALPKGALLARVTPDAVDRLGLAAGVPVLALIKSVAVEVLE